MLRAPSPYDRDYHFNLGYVFVICFRNSLRHNYKRPSGSRGMSVAKIVEIVGNSDKGWEDAAQVAVMEGMKTLRGIRGIEVVDHTAQVDKKVLCCIAFEKTLTI